MPEAPASLLGLVSADLTAELRSDLPVVCVQGLGFVGAAVCIAVAGARDAAGCPAYRAIGVDLPTPEGLERIVALNRGEFPFPVMDPDLADRAREARAQGVLMACAEPKAFALADVIIVDVPLDVRFDIPQPALDLETLRTAIRTVGRHMRADALVVVETTVPPGATDLIVAPILREELTGRGLSADRFLLAHCYERVMPGRGYLDSIVSMRRVYAGRDARSADACEKFLRSIVDADRYPPTRLGSTTASELGKVLENTYRAVTIALMDEFAAFAESIGVELFEVIAPIRARASHSNIRTPGFGVGGYCLTKDPLLAPLAARELFGLDEGFPMAALAVQINRAMPHRVLERLRRELDGRLTGRRILLLGLTYREDVGDTRHSPSQDFYRAGRAAGAEVLVHDPLVAYWREERLEVAQDMPPASGLDAVVLAVPHGFYRAFDYAAWLDGSCPLFLDGFDVLTATRREALRALGCRVESVGRGNGL